MFNIKKTITIELSQSASVNELGIPGHMGRILKPNQQVKIFLM